MENKENDIIKIVNKEINVAKKRIYSKSLNEIIKDFNKEKDCPADFINLVEFIGKDWNVIRTMPCTKRCDFAKHLWENTEKIKNGKYEWWNSEFNAYSYESKICFLIAPCKYKLIYDSHNCEIVRKELNLKDKEINKENWQEMVEEYYKKNHPAAKTDDDFFKIDFETWYRD